MKKYPLPQTMLLLLCLYLTQPTVAASSMSESRVDQATISLSNVSERIAEQLKKPVILPPEFQDKIHVAGQLPKTITLPLFKRILRNNGLTAQVHDDAIEVFYIKSAKTRALPLAGTKSNFDANDFVTATFELKHIDALQLLSLTRTLTPVEGHFTVFRPNNRVIIVDFWDNIQRIEALMKAFDKPLTEAQKARMEEYKKEKDKKR